MTHKLGGLLESEGQPRRESVFVLFVRVRHLEAREALDRLLVRACANTP